MSVFIFDNSAGGSGGSSSWKDPVTDVFSLPSVGNDLGDVRVTTDSVGIFEWDGVAWQDIGGSGSGGSPGSPDGAVQFNSGGTFAGSANFTFDGTDVTVLGSFHMPTTFTSLTFGPGATAFLQYTGSAFEMVNGTTNAAVTIFDTGDVSVTAGVPASTGPGRNVEVVGSGANTEGAGGQFVGLGGNGSGSGFNRSGGTASLTGGNASALSVGASGGDVYLRGGTSGPGGAGGSVVCYAGYGGNDTTVGGTGGQGGVMEFLGAPGGDATAASGSNQGGDGSSIIWGCGTGGNGSGPGGQGGQGGSFNLNAGAKGVGTAGNGQDGTYLFAIAGLPEVRFNNSQGVVVVNKGVTTNWVTNNATITVVSGSTSGSARFMQPERGSAYKKVIIYCSTLLGTASYTFPAGFSQTPQIVATNGPGAAIVTTLSTSGVTVTGATTTGYIILEGN